MTVLIEFEGGLLQNDDLFPFLEEVKNKVPDIVTEKGVKATLNNTKKEINATLSNLKIAEEKQLKEIIELFHEKNSRVWETRLELTAIVKKIDDVNRDFDDRRRAKSLEKIKAEVDQANLDYKLLGTRYVLVPARFQSVEALTSKDELKKDIKDKIISAALQAKANIEQEELLEAARIAKLEKEKVLVEKEKELAQREKDVERIENSDFQAVQAELDQSRSAIQFKERVLNNMRTFQENKNVEIIGRLNDLENRIDPETHYSGQSILNMIKKIKEMLK